MAHDEFSLIRYLTEKLTDSAELSNDVLVGIGDDAAVMRWPATSALVMSCDTMVEHVHFSVQTSRPYEIGYKAMASTISDIAAMGAIPKFVTVSLVLPAHAEPEWLRTMYDGLSMCANKYGVTIVGGDTVSTKGDLAVSLTAVGMLPNGQSALLRSAAQTGDIVFLTNTTGRSAAGLHYLLHHTFIQDDKQSSSAISTLIQEHMAPEPQVTAGELFGTCGLVHALNDVSDGLASESWEIAEASQKGLLLHQHNLPLDEALCRYAESVNLNPLDWVLYGGEDYQLVGTVASANWLSFHSLCEQAGISISAIGEVTDTFVGVQLLSPTGVRLPIQKKGYNHFASGQE